jgi:hypothetical protein
MSNSQWLDIDDLSSISRLRNVIYDVLSNWQRRNIDERLSDPQPLNLDDISVRYFSGFRLFETICNRKHIFSRYPSTIHL